MNRLDPLLEQCFRLLTGRGQILVTAESCTAGLISAALARIPGMSACLAGGFVVYQVDSKIRWLGVSAELVTTHGVVSSQVAESMARLALERTPHATICVSITGHLGPDAPPELDGIAWMGLARSTGPVETHQLMLCSTPLPPVASQGQPHTPMSAVELRRERQQDAVRQVLARLCHRLELL